MLFAVDSHLMSFGSGYIFSK